MILFIRIPEVSRSHLKYVAGIVSSDNQRNDVAYVHWYLASYGKSVWRNTYVHMWYVPPSDSDDDGNPFAGCSDSGTEDAASDNPKF